MTEHTTIGIDLGDTTHTFCVLDHEGNEMAIGTINNTAEDIIGQVASWTGAVIAMEACSHSPWISRLLLERDYTVHVGNPRKLRMIWDASDKTDKRDARLLARVARFDPSLLYPISHRGQDAQRHLLLIRARDALVGARTKLINHVRSAVKVFGYRLPSGISAPAFAVKARKNLPEELVPALSPLLDTIENMTKGIRHYDQQIEAVSTDFYPETGRLRQIRGVGPITSLAFVLTLERASRVAKSRNVGPLLGLVPRRDQSGQTDRQLPITKEGNRYLRRLLVGSAQYILGPFGEECDLRRHGMKIAARGGKNAKKRAVVAVARKLAVLLHRLWRGDEDYNPNYNLNRSGKHKSKQEKASTAEKPTAAKRNVQLPVHQPKQGNLSENIIVI